LTYFDDYKRKLSAYGNSISTVTSNSTIQKINATFADSPFYRNITINGVNTDVRIVQNDEKTPDVKTLLFRPQTVINRGSYAVIDSYTWMLTDFFDNEIFPKATIMRCNLLLKWKDKNGNLHQYWAVVKDISQRELTIKSDKMFDMPNTKMVLSVQFNPDTAAILNKTRFLFNGKPYMITGIDPISHVYNGQGYIDMAFTVDEISPADDLVNDIADNSTIYGNSSAGQSDNQGGAW
jgi:hypothetical protein